MKLGLYDAEVIPPWNRREELDLLTRLEQWLPQGTVLQEGRNRLIRCKLQGPDACRDIVVKCFPRPAGPLRRLGLRTGKARRAWNAATALHAAGIPTPRPVAVLERRHGRELQESYLITDYVPDLLSVRDELNRIYHDAPSSHELIPLLQAVADTARGLHEAGWLHYDLGNQNLLLQRNRSAESPVLLVDLNRARRRTPTLRRIARDLSRLCLPSDFRRILHEMYFNRARPRSFRRWEAAYRTIFAWHTWTRRFRHPLRSRQSPSSAAYPPPRDIWIWDEPTAQAISAWNSRDRLRLHLHHTNDIARITGACLAAAGPLYRAWRQIQQEAWQTPVNLSGRIGIAVNMHPDTRERELQSLQALSPVPIPVLLRACHHEKAAGAARCLEGIQALAHAGHPVTLALVQDRCAVQNPYAWRQFVIALLDQAADLLDAVEIGHAVNRVKWGFWDLAEYNRWLQTCANLPQRYPNLAWYGPATIDFEPHQTLAFLAACPREMRFTALSQHLYVDRRGAPENFQGRFSTVEKAMLFRAIARVSPQCKDRLIVSEVNWPLQGTGIHSPVCSPYLYSGQTVSTNVTEDEAADYMLRYLLRTLCSGMVEQVYWWQLAAHGYGLIDPIDPDGWRPRPAYQALQLFLTHLGNARFEKRPLTPSGIYAFVFAEGDRRHWLLYAHPKIQTFQPPVTWQRSVILGTNVCPDEYVDTPLTLTGTPVLLLNTRDR